MDNQKTDTEKLDDLVEALQLFYRVGPWDEKSQTRWEELTGKADATTRGLCDFARKLIANRPERGRVPFWFLPLLVVLMGLGCVIERVTRPADLEFSRYTRESD